MYIHTLVESDSSIVLWFDFVCKYVNRISYNVSIQLLFFQIAYLHQRMYSIHMMFDGNHNLILQYLTLVQVEVAFFSHVIFIEYLLLNLRLNY